MGTWLDAAAGLVTALALLALVLGLARSRAVLPSLAFMLDLFLAAGLLRLASDPTYQQALVSGLVLAVREVTGRALRRADYHPAGD